MNPLLQSCAVGFRLGVALRRVAYQRGWFKTRRLASPVVSVGNLTTGGTGKTPMVVLVARTLLGRGWKPSILTRGYGRRDTSRLVALAPQPGRRADPREVGDEPAMLAQALPEVPIVVCADRLRAGRLVEERFHADVHILDDGFQHWALARDLDLVVLDPTQKVSDHRLLPAGLQREPLAALERAQVVVITRTDSNDPKPLESLVQNINPSAKVFLCSTQLLTLMDTSNGAAISPENLRSQKAAAFCGIGNPQAFFRDVRRWGFDLTAQDAFPDHHVYTQQELDRLVARARSNGASFLLTTEKDAIKFPKGETGQLPILACAIEAQIPAREEFESTLLKFIVRTKEAHS